MMVIERMDRAVAWASQKLDIIAGVALVAMMALVFGNVVCRAIWKPIMGTYEVTAFLAAMTISFALAHCAVNKGHIALTLFVDRLSPRVRAFFDTIVSILGALLYFILAWEVAKYAIHMRDIGEVSLTMEIPFYPFILGVAFGLLMLALVSLIDLFKSLVRLFNK
ncbi:MAG: TRAP transporter small permease [Desulfobacteraceae bacterium]|jgi:TRAP-type C4-dicarboxylate transport system permease small subunit